MPRADRYPFLVQSLNSAYGLGDRIPWERAHETRHTTLSAARKQLARVKRNRTIGSDGRAICSYGSWNGHERIILAPDAAPRTLRYECICCGPVMDAPVPSCAVSAVVTATWEPGQPQPDCPAPDGWEATHMCGPCGRQDEANRNNYYQEAARG